MEWNVKAPAMHISDLATSVEKTGSGESVAIVAVIWGIALVAAAIAAS